MSNANAGHEARAYDVRTCMDTDVRTIDLADLRRFNRQAISIQLPSAAPAPVAPR
jgi:hypothetical protein